MNGPDLARAVSALVRDEHPNAWLQSARRLSELVDVDAIKVARVFLRAGPLNRTVAGRSAWLAEIRPTTDAAERERLLREGEIRLLDVVARWLEIPPGEPWPGTETPPLHVDDDE